MAIELADDRRDQLIRTLQGLFLEDFDEELSAFRGERLVDWFVEHLGPPIYNQAVQDVRRHLQTRLDDLAGEVFASEVF